ncbi:C-type lectin domain-containing protein [Caenorhabditis elegans]|uniref:C-type lectin domain-containing protein n=1 Tax=Caenorhabditis elegans TaxID=6239 RepID=Q4R111_CAEEL|nr:C-type lectin domain-containing protein [Caenorhabditis elegans]CCD74007.1 C-type lectin domain-containing protein [Caenorhabditis elegans]|eukprot:NP_001033434.1 C-type LECtin [Caenorhabditis elegans]
MIRIKYLIALSSIISLANCRGCLDADDKEIGGICFKFVNQKMTYENARDWCHYKNPVTQSYLALVQNQFTANFVASYGHNAFGSSDATFWIGLSRDRNWNPFVFDNGVTLGQGWSNFDNQNSLNFVAERVSNAKWTTFNDSTTMPFVCSYDPTEPPVFSPPTPSRAPTTTPSTTTTTPGPTTTCKFV